MSENDQESVVIDLWEVPAEHQQEVIASLRELLEQLRLLDGFVEGRIHASLDGTKVVSYSVMRTAADRRAAAERDELREPLRALEAIAHPRRNTYELACVFSARPRGLMEASHGAY